VPASLTTPSRDVIEPTKDYWLDMAALNISRLIAAVA